MILSRRCLLLPYRGPEISIWFRKPQRTPLSPGGEKFFRMPEAWDSHITREESGIRKNIPEIHTLATRNLPVPSG